MSGTNIEAETNAMIQEHQKRGTLTQEQARELREMTKGRENVLLVALNCRETFEQMKDFCSPNKPIIY